MRWFNFAILVFVVLTLQIGVVNKPLGLGAQNIFPNLLLMLLVLITFRGQEEDVLLAGWFLGLAYDLSSGSGLGVYALSFGVMAIVIVRLREFLYGESLTTLVILTFGGSFIIEQFALVIDIWKDTRISWSQYGTLTMGILFSSLLTAGLTPLGKIVINKLCGWLGMPMRRGYRRR